MIQKSDEENIPYMLNTDPKKGRIFKPGIIPAKERNSKTKRTKDRCTAQVKKKKKKTVLC